MTDKTCEEKEYEKKFIEQLKSNGVFENIEEGNEETHACHCLCLRSLGFTPEDVQQYVSYHEDIEDDRNNMKSLLQSYRNLHLQSLHIHKDTLDHIDKLLQQLHTKGGT